MSQNQGEMPLNSSDKRIPVTDKTEAKPIDPWLLWHLERFKSLSDLPGMPQPNQHSGEAGANIGVLIQRPGDNWPADIDIAPYYRVANLEIATGSVAPDQALALNARVPELRTAYAVNPQLAEMATDRGDHPATRDAAGPDFTGAGTIIGFIDNGCAFGHPNFLRRGGSRTTRVLRLWDQSRLSVDYPSPPWVPESDLFGYGAELSQSSMNSLIAEYEDASSPRDMYDAIEYPMMEMMQGVYKNSDYTHGTAVMDIAAGNGFHPGLAREAEIIFVQLPRYASKENTNQASARHILDGAAYIFAHAERLGKPAIVNISYNAFTGSHDGSSLLERGLDRLAEPPGRYIVMSAGNGRKARCHTAGSIDPGERADIKWMTSQADRTQNFVEIWYSGNSTVSVEVIGPDGASSGPPLGVGSQAAVRIGRSTVGFLAHAGPSPGGTKNQILVALHPSAKDSDDERWHVAPGGPWTIVLRNGAGGSIGYHAWIERDDRGVSPAAEQSQFIHADEDSTIGGACTGHKPIVVGACNPANKKRLFYSAVGPTCDTPGRAKPDCYAPGVLRAAQATSAMPITLSGTSMAAAFISGLAAAFLGHGAERDDSAPILLNIMNDMLTCVNPPDAAEHFSNLLRTRQSSKEAASE